jgi:glycosyltransferase involved in cell wall biosynthesis
LEEIVPEPIRVVIACDTFAPDINGAARFAERLAAGLSRRGHEVHIIAPSTTSRAQSGPEIIDGAEMTVHRMPSWKLPQHKTLRYVHPFGLKRRMEQIFKEVNPVALHINSHILIGRFALRAGRHLPALRRVATNHIMPENLMRYSFVPGPLQPAVMRLLWKDAGRVLKRVDVVTTPTRRAANLLEAAADLTGTLAISCGINAARFANDTPTSNHPPRFLYLGRLDAEKRADVLLLAVAELKSHPEIEVELVGDGGERERLQKLAADLGIAGQVQFTGHISEHELPAAYERATAFVMPSIAELQSIATMEAMASGRPVIGADAMALPHLVHDGDNGYLFPADDYRALADRLLRVVQADAAELKRLSENSLHLISSHDINRTLDIFEDLYLGVGAEAPTSDDNEPGYLEPIGRLAEGVRDRLSHWQANALRLRRRADELRELAVERFTEAAEDARERIGEAAHDARERIGEAAHDAKEQLDEFREDIAAAGKRLRKRLRDDD